MGQRRDYSKEEAEKWPVTSSLFLLSWYKLTRNLTNCSFYFLWIFMCPRSPQRFMDFCHQQVGSFTLRFKVNFNFSLRSVRVWLKCHTTDLIFIILKTWISVVITKKVCCKYYHSLALCFRSSVAPVLTSFKMLIVSMKEKCLQRQ